MSDRYVGISRRFSITIIVVILADDISWKLGMNDLANEHVVSAERYFYIGTIVISVS